MSQAIVDLVDELHSIKCRLAFLGTAFSQPMQSTFEFSEESETGFCLILQDIEDGIEHIGADLNKIKGGKRE